MPKFLKEHDEMFKELNERYVNPKKDYVKKLQRFDKIWEKAEILSDYFVSDNVNKSTEEIVKDLVEEFYSYHGSILKSFRNLKSRSFEENVERALELRTKNRFKEFLKVHGEETFDYNGEERTLSKWMEQFLKRKITDTELYEIFREWQDSNPEYDASNYRKSDSAQSILNDRYE